MIARNFVQFMRPQMVVLMLTLIKEYDTDETLDTTI